MQRGAQFVLVALLGINVVWATLFVFGYFAPEPRQFLGHLLSASLLAIAIPLFSKRPWLWACSIWLATGIYCLFVAYPTLVMAFEGSWQTLVHIPAYIFKRQEVSFLFKVDLVLIQYALPIVFSCVSGYALWHLFQSKRLNNA